MNEHSDNLIGRVEEFLKKSDQQKVGFVYNPNKVKELGIQPQALAELLQQGIKNALTSDYAETLETLNPNSFPNMSAKYLRRHIYLRWDGILPSEETNCLRDDREDSPDKVYPYQLILAVSGYSVNIAQFAEIPNDQTLTPTWPDRSEFFMIDRNTHEDTRVDSIISSQGTTTISASTGWFEELELQPGQEVRDLDLISYKIKRVGSHVDRIGTVYKDLYMMRNILMFGELDLPAMTSTRKFLIDNYSAELIEDLKTLDSVSGYFLAAMDKLFPMIEDAANSAFQGQEEFGH